MTRSLVVAFALATTGCTTLTELNAGPVVALPTKEDPSFGGAVNGHAALGPADSRGRAILGYDINAKLKVTSSSQQLAYGNGFLFARTVGGSGEVMMRGGLQLAFERFDEKLLVGGGPYAMLLGGVALDDDVHFVPGNLFTYWQRERTLLTFGPIAEIDARFSRPSAIAFIGIGVGIAFANEVVPRPNIPLTPQEQPPP